MSASSPESPTREVTLVCGPPCGGKSTYVDHHAQPGDLVVCLDQLAVEAGSPRHHEHDQQYYTAGAQRYDALLTEVADMQTGTAWVIRCAPEAEMRAAIADYLRATRTVLLVPPKEVAVQRAREQRDPRIKSAIHIWYHRYTRHPTDEVVAQVLTQPSS